MLKEYEKNHWLDEYTKVRMYDIAVQCLHTAIVPKVAPLIRPYTRSNSPSKSIYVSLLLLHCMRARAWVWVHVSVCVSDYLCLQRLFF